MNIELPNCPESVKQSLSTFLSPNIRKMVGVPDSGMTIGDPHQVFYISPKDLLQHENLSTAKVVAWRVTHKAVGKSVAAEIDVSVRPDNDQVTSLNDGPFAVAPDNYIKRLRQSKSNAPSELRMLRVPELYLMALWLHSSSADIVIPLEPAPPGMLAGQEYSVRGMITALTSSIRRLMAVHPEEDF